MSARYTINKTSAISSYIYFPKRMYIISLFIILPILCTRYLCQSMRINYKLIFSNESMFPCESINCSLIKSFNQISIFLAFNFQYGESKLLDEQYL